MDEDSILASGAQLHILTIRELADRLDSPRRPLVDDPGPILYSLDLEYLASLVNDWEIWGPNGFEEAWIHQWQCEEGPVGFRAIYLDGALVGTAERHSSQSDEEFMWVDNETAMLVRERVKSFVVDDRESKPRLMDTRQYWRTHMEIHSDYEVMDHHLAGQVLCQGQPGRITGTTGLERPWSWGRKPATYNVKLDDGSERVVLLEDLLWALPLRKEEPNA